jgi:hypothetical protein
MIEPLRLPRFEPPTVPTLSAEQQLAREVAIVQDLIDQQGPLSAKQVVAYARAYAGVLRRGPV